MLRTLMVLSGLLLPPFVLFSGASQPVFHADLDTKEGTASKWRADALEATSGCTFEAEFVRAYKHPKWAPAFSFFIGGPSGEGVHLRLSDGDRNGSLQAKLVTRTRNKSSADELDLVAEIGQRMVVALRWKGDTAEFVVDDRVVATVALTFQVAAIEIGVSTAQLKVHNLSFQYVD